MVFSDKNKGNSFKVGHQEFQLNPPQKKQLNKKGVTLKTKQDKAIQKDVDRILKLLPNKISLFEASQLLFDIHRRHPASFLPLYHLADVKLKQMDLVAAERFFKEASLRAPLEAEVLMQLSLVQAKLGKVEEARQNIENGLQLSVTPRGLIAAANIERMTGNKEKALKLLDQALEMDPYFIKTLAIYSEMTKLKPTDQVFITMKKIAMKSQKLSNKDKIALHFALAKAFFDMKEYKEGFAHYKKGNDIKSKNFPMIEGALDRAKAEAELVTSKFTKEKIDELSKKAKIPKDGPVPIFVTGLLRSGTTLTEQIISNQEDVEAAGEVNDFIDSTQTAGAKDNSFEERVNAAMKPENFIKTGEKYLEKLKNVYPDAKYITDKMPFNYMWIGLISLALPQAKIVLLKRNPMDCGLSIYRQNFMAPIPWYYDLKGIGQAYNVFSIYLEHWPKVMGDKIFVLDYDKMVANPEPELRKLIDFLGFEWSDDFLDFHKSKNAVTTASVDQVRRKINTGSLKLWEHIREELEPMYNEVKHLMPEEQ